MLNFGNDGTWKKVQSFHSNGRRYRNKLLVILVVLFLYGLLFAAVVGCASGIGAVQSIIDQSPEITAVDVSPQGISTTVYNSNGELIETLVTSGSNRDPVSYDQIPENLVNAFVSIEDSRFWEHKGVDLRGMARALVLGIQSHLRSTQGASTITQQLIKNNVFDGGSESTLGAKIVRKIQEQYLATELETTMSKQDILENYLNTINLGANALGVQTAARRYFDKDVSELTLSECAVIAGITQNPVGYNPITHPDRNQEKRETILNYMVEQGYITENEREEALADTDDVYARIQTINAQYQEEDNIPYSYFVDRLITEVIDDLQTKCGYSETQAQNLLYSGGLEIYTTQDPDIQEIVDEEVSDPDNYSDVVTKYSFTYALTITRKDKTINYSENDVKKYVGQSHLDYSSKEAIEDLIEEFKAATLKKKDTIVGENLTITLQPQVSVVLMDQSTGYVKAISGGRGEKTTSLSLNRATSTRRSPGSTFKVLTAFAPALDACDATLATTYYDEPYTDESSGKSFRNWWGNSKYAGYSNIRQAITYSMNIVAVRCLSETVTPELGFEYALDFGFNTLYDEKEINGQIYTDITPSLALGGLTDGVTNLQLTAAYAAIANSGTYTEPVFYTKILDHDGNVLIDNTSPEQHEVISESTAFLLTDAMQDSTEYHNMNGLFSSTSTAAALKNMPVAGKSGTSSGKTDLWFVGFTPYYTMGIWSGFDDSTAMDANEGSSSYHKIIWRNIMNRVDELEDLSASKFEVPDNIVSRKICAKSGKLAVDGICTTDDRGGDSIVYTEYFEKGTEPTEYCDRHVSFKACDETGKRATEYCPKTTTSVRLILPDETSGDTQDSQYAGYAYTNCDVHTLEWKQAEESKKAAEESSKKAEEESKKAAEASKKAEEESKKAKEASIKAKEESKKAAAKASGEN